MYLWSTWSYIFASSSTALLRPLVTTESSRTRTFTRSGLVSEENTEVTFVASRSRNWKTSETGTPQDFLTLIYEVIY